MAVIEVKPGADAQALADMARHMSMRVGKQGNFTVLLTPSEFKRKPRTVKKCES